MITQAYQNWYTRFSPDGPLANVHRLIVNRPEYTASSYARNFATVHGQPGVELVMLKPRAKR